MNLKTKILAAALVGACFSTSAFAADAVIVNGQMFKPGVAAKMTAEELRIRAGKPASIGLHTPGNTCSAATNEIGTLPFSQGSSTIGTVDDVQISDTFAGVFATSTTCGGGTGMFGCTEPRGCPFNGTGHGEDQAFRVRASANCTLNISELSGAGYDAALEVHDSSACFDTTLLCVSDLTYDADTESVSLQALAGTDYFVIIDGYDPAEPVPGTEAGPFTLNIDGTGCTLVPVELQSFQIN